MERRKRQFYQRALKQLFPLLLTSICANIARSDCSLTKLGMKPLPELGLSSYKGYPAGLYPNGANNRPPAHFAAGLFIATNQIQPLNSLGNVDTNSGKIVLLSIGMSNTTDEWSSLGTNFSMLADAHPSKNPRW